MLVCQKNMLPFELRDDIAYQAVLESHDRRCGVLTTHPVHDFREEIDCDDEFDAYRRHIKLCLCPKCRGAELHPGEISLCVIPTKLYDRVTLKTKRQVPAFSDAGTPLSSEFCNLVAHSDEILEIIAKHHIRVDEVMAH